MTALWLALAVQAQGPVDEGTLLVRQDTVEIAREAFRLTPAGRRELLAVQDLGIGPTTLDRDPAELRHVTVTGGANRLVHIWLGAEGRLAKVEIPSRGLVATRRPAR